MPQADNEQIADCKQGTRQTKQLQRQRQAEEGRRGVPAGVVDKPEAPKINGQQCELEKFLQSQIEISRALLCIQSCSRSACARGRENDNGINRGYRTSINCNRFL